MNISKKLKTVDFSEIKAYPKNAKIHTDQQVKALAKSIDKYDYLQPIGVDKNNVVVFGHGRLLALQSNEYYGEIEVVDLSGLSPKEIKKLRILDNKVSSTDYDDDLLKQEIESIYINIDHELDKISLELAMSEKEIAGMVDPVETKGDNMCPVSSNPVTKIGDVWNLGDHRVVCGDSTDKDDFCKLIGNEKVDMLFTDPPYGVSYADKNKFLNGRDKGNRIQKEIENDHVDIGECSKLWLDCFRVIIPYLASHSSYYIFSPQGGDLYMMMMMIKESGLQLKHQIIWNKNNHVLGRSDYNYKHEPIFYGWYKKHKFYGKGINKSSVWDYDKPLKNDLHPTMKPVAIIENAILNSTKRDMIVVDCFLGSGSTLIACEKTNRVCRGIEISPQYCDVIRDRYINWCIENGTTPVVKLNGKPYKMKK